MQFIYIYYTTNLLKILFLNKKAFRQNTKGQVIISTPYTGQFSQLLDE